MTAYPREFHLDYLSERKLGQNAGKRRKDVRLLNGNLPSIEERSEYFDWNSFAWKLARRLEGRENVVDSEGVWPINAHRCERKYGNPGYDLFPSKTSLADATSAVYEAAREMRRFCYCRVRNAEEAEILVNRERDVRYATKITAEWYDPPEGQIYIPPNSLDVLGSHAVPLSSVMDCGPKYGKYFWFRNSWGEEWGHNGHGGLSFRHFDRFMIEAWHGIGVGLFAPLHQEDGAICLEWKWSLDATIGIHGREIVDAATSDRLAWAFCRRRDGFLDIEEFFVWPSERGRGYAKVLATMVKKLAASMNLPLRLLVSFADSDLDNVDNLQAAARLLNVHLKVSEEKWVHMVGTSSPAGAARETSRPQRPAFFLEQLWRRDEKPIEDPIEYNLFFGTNRRPFDRNDVSVGFSAQRGDALHMGMTKVIIPKTHRFGCKGRFWFQFWNRIRGQHRTLLESRIFVGNDEFTSVLSRILSEFGKEAHNLLYVHGFNVSFDDAAKQAAYFGVDLKVPGTTFFYSWPSAGRIDKYISDEATIEASIPYLKEFISKILRATNNIPLSVIVHSMGNRAMIRLFETIAQTQSTEAHGRICNVIMAAPDVDSDVFKATIPSFLPLVRRTTLYATNRDLALRTSGWLHSFSRAGLSPPVMSIQGMDTIEVEGFNLLNVGHGYYAEAASLLHDMFVLLHYGSQPGSRPALVPAETLEGNRFWKLQLH